MKFVKIFNILSILLIFTPFVKYCSEDDKHHNPEKEVVNSINNKTNDSKQQIAQTTNKVSESTQKKNKPHKKEENLWDKITLSKEGNYVTGWGIVFYSISDAVEFKFQMAFEWYAITLSFLILLFALYKLIAARFKLLTLYYAINWLLIAFAYISATDGFHDADPIKWGFYAYIASNTVLLVIRLIIRKRCKKESIESILEQT